MRDYLKKSLAGKRILILGYGREGRSTLNMILSVLQAAEITVADQQESAFANDQNIISQNIKTVSGLNYMDNLQGYDIVIKSPGVKLDANVTPFVPSRITSQTDLFLAVYSQQTVGITGTKGKSTTSSLLYHILHSYNGNALLGGNIGIPPFDLVDQITPETIVVCELSSHQLQFTQHAPHIGILLNLFQEHLDHYSSYLDYQKAKYNIALNQSPNDWFIFNGSDENINNLIKEIPVQSSKLPFFEDEMATDPYVSSNNQGKGGIFREGEDYILLQENSRLKVISAGFTTKLKGTHNRNNAIIAAAAATLLSVPADVIEAAVATFNPLEHRLEYVGTFYGVEYYNDSISTIPEAAIAAVKSLKRVDTLILGGFDRTIDYQILADFLNDGIVKSVITTGPAGLRIFELIQDNVNIDELHYYAKFDEAVLKATEITPKGGVCLLSPAASSYNEFVNFEARGIRYKELVSKS